jgi:hypothetical protein
MQRAVVHAVGDSSDEESTHNSGAIEREAERVALNREADRSADDAAHAARRRDFLRGTARSLILSRVRELRELQQVVDDLSNAVAQLNTVRDAIERACNLHASLGRLLDEDMQQANAIIESYSFSPDEERALSFSDNLASVVAMFMVNMDSGSR